MGETADDYRLRRAEEAGVDMRAKLTALAAGDVEVFRTAVSESWLEHYERVERERWGADDRPIEPAGARTRASWAANCARELGYKIMGEEQTEPPSIASKWTFRMGNLVGDDWQPALTAAFDAELEVVGSYLDGEGGIHLDAKLTLDDFCGACAGAGERFVVGLSAEGETDPCPECAGTGDGRCQVVELKSRNGFGFKKMIGDRGTPEGPRTSEMTQLAIQAANTPGCIGGWLLVVALENLSVNAAEKAGVDEIGRFLKAYYFPIDQLRGIAEREEKRVARVLEIVDARLVAIAERKGGHGPGDDAHLPPLPPRAIPDPEIPAQARITDPASGRWELVVDGELRDFGETWRCSYCSFRSRCIRDGAS